MSNSFIQSFLSSFSNNSGPGLIKLEHQTFTKPIIGILASEITVSASSNYGSIIPDLSTLADLASIAGFATLPTWIGASALMWRGTNPITFGADMYLVNYEPNLSHEENLKKLAKLCTLGESDDSSMWRVQVHGGYSTDAFANNKQYFAGRVAETYSALSEEGGLKDENVKSKFSSLFKGKDELDITGTLTVSVGSKFRLAYLLLTRIDVTPSLVEVSEDGKTGKPLFYKVGMNFTTCRSGLSDDVNNMF